MTSFSANLLASFMDTSNILLTVIANIISMLVPLVYIVGYITWKVRKLPKKCIRKTMSTYNRFMTTDDASPLINYGV